MRHAAFRRRFKECFCKRCSNYDHIDRMLCPLVVDKELKELEEAFREASVGKCHCESLENFPVYGDFKAHPVEQELKMKLKPSNYLYVKAYKILATSFRSRGEEARARMHPNVISRLQRRTDGAEDSALALFKASAAYCLRGAMSIHHLFVSDPSILPIAAAAWVKAGEGLIYYWGRAEPAGLRKLETLVDFECSECLNIKCSSHNIDPQILVDCMEGISAGCASYIFSDKMFLLNGKTASSADVAMLPSVMAMGLHCLRFGAVLMNMSYGSSIHRTYIKSLEKLESLHDV